jgi:hypothetical protein
MAALRRLGPRHTRTEFGARRQFSGAAEAQPPEASVGCCGRALRSACRVSALEYQPTSSIRESAMMQGSPHPHPYPLVEGDHGARWRDAGVHGAAPVRKRNDLPRQFHSGSSGSACENRRCNESAVLPRSSVAPLPMPRPSPEQICPIAAPTASFGPLGIAAR